MGNNLGVLMVPFVLMLTTQSSQYFGTCSQKRCYCRNFMAYHFWCPPLNPSFNQLAWSFDKIRKRHFRIKIGQNHLGFTLECLLLTWIVSGPVCLSPGSYWFIRNNVIFTSLYIMYKLENEKCVNNIV